MKVNEIYQGNALEVQKTFPEKSIDMCITSPPYFGLRDYGLPDILWDAKDNCEHEWGTKLIQKKSGGGQKETTFLKGRNLDGINSGTELNQGQFCQMCGAWKGQLGLEPTPELYIKHLCDIFDETKRVLKDTGSLWVNISDSYGGSGNASGHTLPKSLLGIPERFVLEMMNRGWIRRNTIIWYKPNCMPTSASDRFTIDFEYLYFFSKSNKVQYWTNDKTNERVDKKPLGTKGIEGVDWDWKEVAVYIPDRSKKQDMLGNPTYTGFNARYNNKATKELKKISNWVGHDYYFEQQLESWTDQRKSDIERAEDGTYKYDGKYKKGYEKANTRDDHLSAHATGQPIGNPEKGRNKRCVWRITLQPFKEAHFATFPEKLCETPIRAGCPKNGNVLDMFFGSGTVGVVARKLGRNYIGIELNPEYINIAKGRLKEVQQFLL